MKWLLIPAGLLFMAMVNAADVYRWTDEHGRVHYSERPPAQGAQRLDLPASAPVQPAPDLGAAERRARQQRMLDAYAYEREQKKAEQDEVAARREERARECKRLQSYWRRLSFSGPIYIKGDDGERRYLSDQQRVAEMERLRPAYRAACGREP